MSEEPLQRAEQAIKEGREAADEAPVMPFGDTDDAAGDAADDAAGDAAGEEPEETGGAVAQHGNDEE